MFKKILAAGVLTMGLVPVVSNVVEAAPTGCIAVGVNTNRGVVYSVCTSGSGQHRSFGTFRKGVILYTDVGPWQSATVRSYSYGPVGSVFTGGTVQTRN